MIKYKKPKIKEKKFKTLFFMNERLLSGDFTSHSLLAASYGYCPGGCVGFCGYVSRSC